MKRIYFALAFIFLCFNTLKSADMIGYFHNWNDANAPYIQLDNIDSRYSYIVVSFAIPTSNTNMTMNFVPDGVLETEFISKIQSLKANGKKVILSIGGATSYIDISNIQQKDNFVSSLNSILNTYGFDGLDIDIESGNSILITNGSTISNPLNPSMINLIDAIKQIMANFRSTNNKKMILTLAPETAYVQGGQSGFGSIWGGYLPIIHALRDSIDILQVQLYNSGTMYGLDGNIYSQGTADFIISMTEAAIRGFNTAGGFFTGLGESKVAVGLPACSSAAGGGFVDTNTVKAAMNYLLGKGAKPGTYTLINSVAYPNLRGMMTWSINWDAVANCGGRYSYANNYSKIFNQVPIYNLTVNYGSGSGNYKKDTTIKVIANIPEKGYRFVKWNGDISYLSDLYNDTAFVTIPEKDIVLTAIYEKIRYNLIIENGFGSGDYYAESIININANIPSKKKFSNWTGNTELIISSNKDSALIVMPYSNAKLTANFEFIKYKLNVIDGSGSGEYIPETYVDIIADKAPKGYKFIKWNGDTSLIKDIYKDSISIRMPEWDVNLKAEYILIKYKLSVIKGSGSGDYEPGKTVLIKAEAPENGYVFDKWSGDISYLEDFTKDSTIATIPDKDISLSAEYIKVKIDSSNLIVKDGFGSGRYKVGSKVKIYFQKTRHNQWFQHWIGDTIFVENPYSDTTIANIPNKDITIEAYYLLFGSVIEELTSNILEKYENCIEIKIEVYDLTGSLINFYEKIEDFQVKDLTAGVYFCKISCGNDIYNYKVMISE